MFAKVAILIVLIAALSAGASAQSAAATAICRDIQNKGNSPVLNGRNCLIDCCVDENVCQNSIVIFGQCENQQASASTSQQSCDDINDYINASGLRSDGCFVSSCNVNSIHVTINANC